MDKKKLAQLRYLKKEIEELEKRIEKDKELLAELEQETVTDSVTCGKKGKKPLQSVKISGFPVKEYTHRRALLNARKHILEMRKTEVIKQEKEIQEYITSVQDCYIRLIIQYRYLDGLTWEQVAIKLGGYNTEDSVRKTLDRYLEKGQAEGNENDKDNC